MNKAFVREPDPDVAPLCPVCGSLATPVGTETLDALVHADSRHRAGKDAWYCTRESCGIVYFNPFGLQLRTTDLRHAVWPYDSAAPICPCFGFHYDDLLNEVDAEQPARIRELIAKSRTADARCVSRTVDGQCCTREIQRLYLKLKSASGSGPP